MTDTEIKILTQGGVTIPEIIAAIYGGYGYELSLLIEIYNNKALPYKIKLDKAIKMRAKKKSGPRQLKLNLA